MKELGLSQNDVARACGLSQPHMSRVLSGGLSPGRKTSTALAAWLQQEPPNDASKQLERLGELIESTSPRRRMHVMQFLASLELLLTR
ncbi:helix-turn-helix domain-containing protein [Brevundimonas sp.]|uniref:helix-turn-helix domain-containing protein n=1 Tax=Brevundimonas sp. TaxID=1871086 RepID=UPI00344F68EB